MTAEFRMPSLGADMEAGTLVEWLVKAGDTVKRGDVVAVVETQKGAIEVEIFVDGRIAKILVPVGARVPVGTALAMVGSDGEIAVPALPTEPQIPAPPTPLPPASAGPDTTAPTPPRTHPPRQRLTPAARRRAAEIGIATESIAGTGVDGAICLADIDAAAATARTGRPRKGFDVTAMRQAIAAAMTRSKREIPHYYLTQTVDMSTALARIETLNRDRPPTTRLLPAVMLLRASAIALARVPELNGFWEADGFRPGDGVHLGWAIALRGGGLVAPAIRDADRRDVDALMAAMRDLVQRARSGGLRSSELSDPTATVTSLGDRGADSVLPIIQPPQVAMIGFGRIVTRPWVVDGAIGPRPVVSVTLAGDHRASDGHRGGLLLAEIERALLEPDTP